MDAVPRPRVGHRNHEVPPGSNGGPMHNARFSRGRLSPARYPVRLSTSLVLLVVLLACDDAAPFVAATGSIEVTAFTAGPDQDVDGYTVLVDGQRAADISTSGTRVIENVPVGPHILRLNGIAANCTPDVADRTVTVAANQRSAVELVITCVLRNPGPLPTSGTLRITTATTGPEQDDNGYRALVSTFHNAPPDYVFLPTNGTTSINLAVGSRYFVALSDVAPNCRIQTDVSPDQVADIVASAVASVSFAIACQPTYAARLPAGSQLAFVRNGQIHLVNSDGSGIVRLTDGPNDCDPSWSPDGQRLAFVRGCNDQAAAIYLLNADGSRLTRRTFGGYSASPSWSPDGSRIAVVMLSQGSAGVFMISANDDGKTPIELVNRLGYDGSPSWSPDGKSIAFVSDAAFYDEADDIYVTSVATGTISQLTEGFAGWPGLLQYYEPAWSPDGSRIALTRCPQAIYRCDVSHVVVMGTDGKGITPVVATRGLASPTWSPDGAVIAFSSLGTIGWVRPLTGERGFIVDQGQSPAWRPVAASRIAGR